MQGEIEADQTQLEFASRYILEQLGVVIEEEAPNYLDDMLARFGGKFPPTRIFSAYARDTVDHCDLVAGPDAAIMAMMERRRSCSGR